MSNAVVLKFTGGRRCLVCRDQIDPARVRANPDIATCDAGCSIEYDKMRTALFGTAPKRDTLVIDS